MNSSSSSETSPAAASAPQSPAISYRNEVYRKLIHMTSAVFAVIYAFVSQPLMAWISGALVLILLTLDSLRLVYPQLNVAGNRMFGLVLRASESSRLTGATWMAIAGFLCVLLFPKPIAIVAFLFIAISDAFAALVGRKWGRAAPGRKSLLGSAAFLVSALIIALLLLRGEPLAAALGALAATISEAARLRIGPLEVDDNLLVAMVSGGVMLAAVRLWP